MHYCFKIHFFYTVTDLLCLYFCCTKQQLAVPQPIQNCPFRRTTGSCTCYSDAVLWMAAAVHTHRERTAVHRGVCYTYYIMFHNHRCFPLSCNSSFNTMIILFPILIQLLQLLESYLSAASITAENSIQFSQANLSETADIVLVCKCSYVNRQLTMRYQISHRQGLLA